MPTLLIFAPCEKVILDHNNNPTLVVLMEKVNLDIRSLEQELPKNTTGPKEWAIFTRWQSSPEDMGKDFVQRVRILWPDKAEFQKQEARFKATEVLAHITINILGFPIGQEGPITIQVWLEHNEKIVSPEYSFALTVVHNFKMQ